LGGNIEIKSEITLFGTENGKIEVGELKEPYGEGSNSVVSVAVALNGSEPDWKVHIPFENLDAVIEALQSLKK
jgi:hypothetical protein